MTGSSPSSSPGAPRFAVLCRFGELFLKCGNRNQFEQRLRANITQALAGLSGVTVRTPHARVIVEVAGDADRAAEVASRLRRVFGLVSVSPCLAVEPTLAAVTQAAVDLAREACLATRPRSFKIVSRRSDKTFSPASPEIVRWVGGAVIDATGLPVDVHEPDLTIGIEIHSHCAYVHREHLPAPGGLPVGSSGRGLLLLSGGIDSPVAGWLAAKRGLALDALYFHAPPFTGEKSRDKVISLARTLGEWQVLSKVTVVSFTETQKRIRDNGRLDMAVVLYRRMMMRVADAIGDQMGASCLVTGENLGQVASQTIANMTVIQAAARRVVLRPLVTFDKNETIVLAKHIGTFETSILPFDDCCSLFVPKHPATSSRLQDAEKLEAKLDVAAEVAEILASAETVDVRRARGRSTTDEARSSAAAAASSPEAQAS